jgi:Holliday junction resolvasome RuvABC endonuclease subunit
MSKKPLKIIGINPGSKYLGIAIFQGSDLRYWGIKVLKGKWSKEKMERAKEILSDLIDQYDLNVLAIKRLHPSRSSKNLNQLVARIKDFLKRKGLRIYEFSLKDLEKFFSPEEKINKRKMAELVASDYPFLFQMLEKERRNKNPYAIRMFEAIALGIRCFHQLDKH